MALDVAILIAAITGTVLTALAIMLQVRWRRPLLHVEFNRFGSEGPGSVVVTAAVRNDGEGTVAYLQPVVLLAGKRFEHSQRRMPLLGHERTATFNFSLPIDGDPADTGLLLEITYGRRGITGKRKRETVQWGADSTLLY
jgi:hypothetical protein